MFGVQIRNFPNSLRLGSGYESRAYPIFELVHFRLFSYPRLPDLLKFMSWKHRLHELISMALT